MYYYKYSQERASTADNEYIQYIIDGIANDPFLTPLTGSISIPDTLFDDAVLEDILLPQELPSLATSEGSWLCQWKKLTSRASYGPNIPPEACSVTTPLILSAWRCLLLSHSHRELVHFFLQGIANGFRIGFALDATNLKSSQAQHAFHHAPPRSC